MLKDILVHLTGSTEDEVRLTYAEALAQRFDAHLTGMLMHEVPELIATPDPYGVAAMSAWIDESAARADEAEKRLATRFERLAVPNQISRIDAYRRGTGPMLAAEARTADLFVCTRPYGDPMGEAHVEEAVLFGSGRGCLFLPPQQPVMMALDTVLIGWKSTREAAHAVAEAMPLLKAAGQVVVAMVEEDASEQFGRQAGGDIGRHLSRHGISAEIRPISGWVDAGQAILNEARQVGANLLVMGGYGHSRFREWVLGGATRQVLSDAHIPVLMAR